LPKKKGSQAVAKEKGPPRKKKRFPFLSMRGKGSPKASTNQRALLLVMERGGRKEKSTLLYQEKKSLAAPVVRNAAILTKKGGEAEGERLGSGKKKEKCFVNAPSRKVT